MMTNYRCYAWTQALKPWPADHGPEQWTADLLTAGWTEVRLNVWRSPDGGLHRGPYGAWCELHSGRDNNTPITPIPIPEAK